MLQLHIAIIYRISCKESLEFRVWHLWSAIVSNGLRWVAVCGLCGGTGGCQVEMSIGIYIYNEIESTLVGVDGCVRKWGIDRKWSHGQWSRQKIGNMMNDDSLIN